jgi:hypothetical protein
MAMKVIPAAQAELLKKINSVEGFDPEAFTTEYTDMNSGETRKHLPVMAQRLETQKIIARRVEIQIETIARTESLFIFNFPYIVRGLIV